MSHIAIQEALKGRVGEWMEKVTEEQYNATAATEPGARPATPAQIKQPNVGGRRLSPEDVQRVAQALEMYTQDRLYGEVWKRPSLNRAMDNGLTQAQAGEAMTHLAFYAGWPNVFSALPVAKEVFEKRPR